MLRKSRALPGFFFAAARTHRRALTAGRAPQARRPGRGPGDLVMRRRGRTYRRHPNPSSGAFAPRRPWLVPTFHRLPRRCVRAAARGRPHAAALLHALARSPGPRLGAAGRHRREPPALLIRVALPGVRPGSVEVRTDGVAPARHRRCGAWTLRAGDTIHRLEIPHGRFERRIDLPRGRYELAARDLVDGCLPSSCCASTERRHGPRQPRPSSRVPTPRRRPQAARPDGRHARRRADHRAGAQPRAVPRPHRAAGRRPPGVDRGRAGSRAHRAAHRRAAAAPRRHGRSRRPATSTPSARSRPILRYVTAPDGSHQLVLHGEQRFRVAGFYDEQLPFPVARVEMLPDATEVTPDIEARMLQVKARAAELLELAPRVPPELAAADRADRDARRAGRLHRRPASTSRRAEKQDILETVDVDRAPRRRAAPHARAHRGAAAVEGDRRADAGAAREPPARGAAARAAARRSRRSSARTTARPPSRRSSTSRSTRRGMPEEVEKHARKELKRLAQMSESSPEYSMVRTYLDGSSSCRGRTRPEEPIEIDQARAHPRRRSLRPRRR